MKLDFLTKQIEWVDKWTSVLISNIDEKYYGIVPNLDTSINWEIDHIIISKYFHSIQSILDKDSEIIKEINRKIPVKDLSNTISLVAIHLNIGITDRIKYN